MSDVARDIVEKIEKDIESRFIGYHWLDMDPEAKETILSSWVGIVKDVLGRYETNGRPKWDESRDENETCKCGHPYYRHFDTYDDMYPIGCKYCNCTEFETDTNGGIKSATEICSICHAKLNDDLKTCAKCGKEVEPWSPKA